jgi:hypothetical protein
MSRKHLLLWAAALLPLAVACLVLTLRPARPRLGPDWTPQRLREELGRAGVRYEGLQTAIGYILRPASDKTPWVDLEGRLRGMVLARCRPGEPLLVTTQQPGMDTPDRPEDGVFVLGRLVVRGHPDDLARIEGALREAAELPVMSP